MTFGPQKMDPYNELRNSHVFKVLNHEMLANYQCIFLSENTWIFGQGDRDEAVELLDRMPCSTRQMARNVQTAFTTQDQYLILTSRSALTSKKTHKTSAMRLICFEQKCSTAERLWLNIRATRN